MSDEARKHLKELRAQISINDRELRQIKQKKLENEVALKIIKVIKVMNEAQMTLDPNGVKAVFDEVDLQAAQIVSYLRENLG